MSESTKAAGPVNRMTRRGWVGIGSAVVASGLLYAGVVAIYGLSTVPTGTAECIASASPDEMIITVVPTAVDAVSNRILATADIADFGPLDTDEGLNLLTQPLTVLTTEVDGSRSTTIAPGELPPTISVKFITDGTVEQWPFDVHSTQPTILAYQTVDEQRVGVPLKVCVGAQVPGWSIASTSGSNADSESANVEVPITATRSTATVAFGFVLLGLLAVLPVLSLTIAVAGLRGRRKVEATLTSWMAAMLFAVIPLRGFLPGSPPIGSWIDYLLVLWVVAGLVLALALYVVAFMRWAPNGPDGPIVRRRAG